MNGAHILIVDDEPANRRLLETLLHPEGYATTSVASGTDALAAVRRSPPDLILLDVMMPDMDGHAVTLALKGNPATCNIPIILVTAQNDRGARLAGLDSGAEDFLCKPVDRAELWLRVRNLLRLKAYGDLLAGRSSSLQQEVAARTAELERFHSAMDATADVILLVDRETLRYVDANASAAAILGYSRAELLAMGPDQLDGRTQAELAASFDDLIAGGSCEPLVNLRRRDGSLVHFEAHRHAHRSGDGWIIVEVLRDITERLAAERQLHQMAHFDALTGLPNRTQFRETLDKTLSQLEGTDWHAVVMFIDVDNFKNVNDTLGHAIGDELLVQVSRRLVRCMRVCDTVGRLGGDEFSLILVMRDGAVGATVVATKIRDVLAVPFNVAGHEVTVTVSTGITVHPADASEPEMLIKYADTAMYSAKHAGRDGFCFFTAKMNIEVLARLDLENALRKAIEREEFVLHYQPKVQLATGIVVGVEALLRWERPGHGLVPPADFIPALEASGLIVRVGSWVIANACRQIGLWLRSGVGPVQVSVNVASRQFFEGDLQGDVLGALERNDVPAELLELELTESTLMENTQRTIALLRSLRARGVRVSIDDFGTGYSSLAYLRRFPIDKLKIDIAFIRDVTHIPDAAAIVLAIIHMAHSLHLEVVAEGVETAAQLAYLRKHRCDQLQGHCFSRPLPVAQLEQLLGEKRRLDPPDGIDSARVDWVLVVDDDPALRQRLSLLFEHDGYGVLAARSPTEAFELLALHDVQVILCDSEVAGMDGIEFLARVGAMYPDTLRIMLSATGDLASIIHAINQGTVFRFYPRPCQPRELRGHVHEAFRLYWQRHDASAPDPIPVPGMTGRPAAAVAAG
jgi:diguanylate cyclase (GGDEF)-like protein/PAS domain S-box-containing protein